MGRSGQTKIPAILAERYDKIIALEEAREILANLSRNEQGIEAERNFLRQQVETLENDLRNSEPEAMAVIDTIADKPAAWTAARLHYLLGYKWEAAAKKMGITAEAARAKLCRAFEKTSSEKTSIKGNEA